MVRDGCGYPPLTDCHLALGSLLLGWASGSEETWPAGLAGTLTVPRSVCFSMCTVERWVSGDVYAMLTVLP